MGNINSSTDSLSQTYELGQARLNLRSSLRFTLHRDASSPWYLVEDEAAGDFYRIGVVEYAFLSLLDGKRTLDEAIAQLSSLACCGDLDESKAASLTRWIIDSGLAETSAAKSSERIQEQRSRESSQKMFEWMNPIAFRLPIFNPEKFLTRLYGWVRPFAGWPVLVVWLMVCVTGLLTLTMVWEDFWIGQIQAFSRFDAIWLAATWLLLKAVHETSHGLMCKHYGGRVPQFGLLMLLLIPLPFVDVTSSWRFSLKRQRILTAAAGMLAEAFLASIAICIWASSPPGPVQYHMGNLFIAATINTLLFNANPLMKFDGYYILVDWLEIPNLYTRGRTFVKSWMKWLFFGVAFDSDTEPSKMKIRLVRLYGVAAMVWFVLICLSLGTAAVSMLSGIGLLVALAAGVLWVGIPLVRLGKYVFFRQETESPSRIRFVALCVGIAALSYGLATELPGPGTVVAPIVIVNGEVAEIRTRSAGFVRCIHVGNGQEVEVGAKLLTLDNPQLNANIVEMESRLAASRLKANVYKNEEDLATWQIENETAKGLQAQLKELEQRKDQLTLLAPVGGTIEAKNLEQLDGVYLGVGEAVLSIGTVGSNRAIAMVAQDDAVWLRSSEQTKRALIRVWGNEELIRGDIVDISPRATDRVPHFAFASNYGGPLAVVDRQQVESRIAAGSSAMQRKADKIRSSRTNALVHFASHQHGTQTEETKLVQQYVPVVVELSERLQKNYRTGQTGIMKVAGREVSLGDYVYQNVSRWVRSKIQLTHGL